MSPPPFDTDDKESLGGSGDAGDEGDGDGESRRYYGKYRGVVVSNFDPMYLGRVTVKVPDVYGMSVSHLAMPCLPVAGIASGLCVVPPVGASVWVEFEQGNAEKPIWTGCFWELSTQVPTEAFKPAPTNFALKTLGKNSITIDDTTMTMKLKTITGNEIAIAPSGITLKTAAGSSLAITPSGITMQVSPAGPKLALDAKGAELSTPTGASVKLLGTMVSINGESLKVVG